MDLYHHVGLHVDVNLEGKTVGEEFFPVETWVPGVIVGIGALGRSLTVELDTPIGGGTPGFLGRKSRGQKLLSVQPEEVRPKELSEVVPGGIPQEIIDLAHSGRTLEAIKKYRALNGATLDEAKAAVRNL